MKLPELRLFAVLLVILLGGAEALLAYNTIYTEGEVLQGGYWLLVMLNIPILVCAVAKPRYGMWAGLGLAMLLLPWQTMQNRRLVQLHEDVVGVVRYVEGQKKSGGSYPKNLSGHQFEHNWVKGNVSYSTADGSFRIGYYLNDPGIGYWYTPEGGFDYYPD